MKNLLVLLFGLVLVLTSCERESKKEHEKVDVVLTNGIGKSVTLPVVKIGEGYGRAENQVSFVISDNRLRELIVEASAKSLQSCKHKFTYDPYAVFVKVDEFRDVIVFIRATVYNDKGDEVNISTGTVFSGNEIYEFWINELKP